MTLPSFADGVPIMSALGHACDFTSSINGRDYRVLIDVPAGDPPAAGFPVVYLLDGNIHFGAAVGMVRGLVLAGEIRPAVVVGIGYQTDDLPSGGVLRFRDLSLAATAEWIASLGWSAPGMEVDNTGGVDAFLDVIDREIRPALAKLVTVDPGDQSLFGHSLAGHAVLHALFSRPSSYRAFVAASPSIWWSDNAVLAGEARFCELVEGMAAKPRLLLCVGALEAQPDRNVLRHWQNRELAEAASAQSRMVDNVTELGNRLTENTGCAVTTTVFGDEGHISVIPAALCRALQFALGVEATS